MKKRIIGGTGFAVLCFSSLLFGFFNIVLFLFLLVGIYEIYILFKVSCDKKYSFFFLIYYLLAIFSLTALYNIHPIYIFALISGIMLSDTFAFFVGKKYGKTMLSSISPNKTIEGLYGGVICAILVYILYYFTLGRLFSTNYDEISFGMQIVLNSTTLLIAAIGDLFESKLKRNSDAKDSGNIIYGHGGLLDRIDSWLLSSIYFYIVIIIFT